MQKRMEEVVQENMQIGSLGNQGDVAPKMNMDDVATYHSGKQEELEVTIKKHKIGNLEKYQKSTTRMNECCLEIEDFTRTNVKPYQKPSSLVT